MNQPQIIYKDEQIIVCIKPARVLSTDEPGGLPDMIRDALSDPKACVRTVHRLDRVVSGLMVLARTPHAASELSRQIRCGEFHKSYMAVAHGTPEPSSGQMVDLLARDKKERKTYVVTKPDKGVQEAILEYKVLNSSDALCKVLIHLITGRTHQIRCQFSARNFPLVGDRKYSLNEDPCEIALWSHSITFQHPTSKKTMNFIASPPDVYPWNTF